jgi:hypothetical protein
VSRFVDLFVSSAAPLEELAATIAARTSLRVQGPADDGGTVLSDGDRAAVLAEHRFVDDGDLLLGAYRYALSMRTTVSGHLGLSPETALLRGVAAALADHRVLLVLDLQHRLGPIEALDGSND